MDKYEYKLKLDEMKSLAGEGNYERAEEIADSVNWKKIKNVNFLVLAGEIYSKVERFDDSREVLLMAYDRSPIGRMIIYRLAELAIQTHNFDEAKDYYDEFVEIAPHDNLRYVLRYKMSKEQHQPILEQIKILEELKEQEYTEKWAYELAYLYHQAGMSDKCIDACDELELWFGDGEYVEKSLELKMLYQPLTKQQEEKYRIFRREKSEREGVLLVKQDEDLESGEIVAETVQIPKVTTNTGKFNTVNLQQELAKSMQQIMDATEKETVSDTMDNIKKMVEDIPYLQLSQEEEDVQISEEKYGHIETDEEIDGSLKINFQEMIGEEQDGQLSLNVPEHTLLERQITGQMSISDVLDEWEKTKHAAEVALEDAKQRKLESAKARALQEAEEIMERLKDVVPQLDAGCTPKELLEKEYSTGETNGDVAAGKLVANMNQILQQEIDKLSKTTENLDKMLQEKMEESEEDQEQVLKKKMIQPTKRIPSLEAFMKKTFFQDDDDLFAEDDIYDDTTLEDLNADENIFEESEKDTNEIFQEDATDENLCEIPEEVLDETVEQTMEENVDGEEDPQEEPMLKETDSEENIEENTQEDTDEIDARPEMESQEMDNFEDPNEELPEDAVSTQDLEEMHQGLEQALNQETEEQQKNENTDMSNLLESAVEDELPEKLDEDEKEIFSYFVPVGGMENQIIGALYGSSKHLDRDDTLGNILIQGVHGSGKTVLATSIVKALQKKTGRPDGRVGKIEGASLNQKDIPMLLKKVAGGCLIIEHAGDISRETAIRMALCMESDESGILLIMEDTKEGLKKALGRDEGFAKKFSEKIMIPIFTSDELVAFAKSYANESGYDIDEMGTLALYNRISNIQRLDEPTNLIEVKEIVDEAISRAEKGGIKKMFSILTSKRYTEDDYIALREKDFEE